MAISVARAPAPALAVDEAPLVALELPAPVAADGTAIVLVGVGTPEVKGTAVADVAPAKAADVADGAADVALGLRTLSSRISKIYCSMYKECIGVICRQRLLKVTKRNRCIQRLKTYPSMTWTTPFATKTFGTMTLAWLTKIEPFDTASVKLLPWRVGTVLLVTSVLYATVPLMI